MSKWTKEEKDIFNLTQEIEKLGAHPMLTDVVILLGEARARLSEWVDLQIELNEKERK